jgi:hypothetical protein
MREILAGRSRKLARDPTTIGTHMIVSEEPTMVPCGTFIYARRTLPLPTDVRCFGPVGMVEFAASRLDVR